jgi:hypothetical protein
VQAGELVRIHEVVLGDASSVQEPKMGKQLFVVQGVIRMTVIIPSNHSRGSCQPALQRELREGGLDVGPDFLWSEAEPGGHIGIVSALRGEIEDASLLSP